MQKKLALLLIMFLIVLLALSSSKNTVVGKAAGIDAPPAVLVPPSVSVPTHLSGAKYFKWDIKMPLTNPKNWNVVDVVGEPAIYFQGNLYVEKGDGGGIIDYRNVPVNCSISGTGGTITPATDSDPIATFDGNAYLDCNLPSIMDIAGPSGIPAMSVDGLNYGYPIHDYEDFRDAFGESDAKLRIEFQALSNPPGGTIFEHPSMELSQAGATSYIAEIYDDQGSTGGNYYATKHYSSSISLLASPITVFELKSSGTSGEVGWGNSDGTTYISRPGENFAWCMNAVSLKIGKGFTGKLGDLIIDPITSQSTGGSHVVQPPKLTPSTTPSSTSTLTVTSKNCQKTTRSSMTVTPTDTQTKIIPPTFTPTATHTATVSVTPTVTQTHTPTPTDVTTTPNLCAPVSLPAIVPTKVIDPQTQHTFTVNSLNDTTDISSGNGVCSDASGNCTLRAAVMEANALAGVDKIILPTGTYSMTISGAGEDNAYTGDYDIKGSVIIAGTGPSTTIIDAQGLDRVFHVISGTLNIHDVTIQNGNTGTLPVDEGDGGNILVGLFSGPSSANLIATNLTIQNGTAWNGGGIRFYKATDSRIRSVVLKNNRAIIWGGGAMLIEESNVHIQDTHIIKNTANAPVGWAAGAGMYITPNSKVTIQHSIIAWNEAFAGGNGGGIYDNGTLVVTNSLIYGNKAGNAAGALIVDNNGTADITNTTITCNQATGFGNVTLDGGLWLKIHYSTIAYNTAGHGSAVTNQVQVDNSILYGNRNTSNILDNCPFISLGYNMVDAPFCPGPAHLFSDPWLGPLGDDGGNTLTYPLKPFSPAIDSAALAGCPPTDQREGGFIRPMGAGCDRGAYEVQQKTMSFPPMPHQAGCIRESSEWSSVGGTLNSTASILTLGDDSIRRQYRCILSFSTSSLPDNAIITSVILKVRKQGSLGGGDPALILKGFISDLKKGFFGTTPALQTSDFQASTSGSYGWPVPAVSTGNWYNIDLTSGQAYINRLATNAGLTQIRLRFKLDDNNNAIANILNLYSGNAVAANRPQLVITYMLP